jgi:hypothetical protein
MPLTGMYVTCTSTHLAGLRALQSSFGPACSNPSLKKGACFRIGRKNIPGNPALPHIPFNTSYREAVSPSTSLHVGYNLAKMGES